MQNQYTPQPEARGGVPDNELDLDMVNLLNAPVGARSVASGVPAQLTQELVLSEKAIHHVKNIAMESVRLWGYDWLAFEVGVVVTELLTNVMRHANVPNMLEKRASFLIQALPTAQEDGRLVVVIHDDDPNVPRERFAEDDATSGRGLPLVRGLTHCFVFVPAEAGKDAVAVFRLGETGDKPEGPRGVTA
ncbi:ATP-binding protein [Streptomyces sp. NPDC005435]|uniref:ATP-binding protein n=1 Tax=Streptomyces sp. NPDC005435 TaxID=3154464 RepID=UPI003452CAA2